MEEHKQRVKALEEADYSAFDERRAKAADELMWMDFETRIRDMCKSLVMPALNLSVEDREANIELDCKMQKLNLRAELLEQAVFKKDGSLGRTIFDDYKDKMSEMSIFLRSET